MTGAEIVAVTLLCSLLAVGIACAIGFTAMSVWRGTRQSSRRPRKPQPQERAPQPEISPERWQELQQGMEVVARERPDLIPGSPHPVGAHPFQVNTLPGRAFQPIADRTAFHPQHRKPLPPTPADLAAPPLPHPPPRELPPTPDEWAAIAEQKGAAPSPPAPQGTGIDWSQLVRRQRQIDTQRDAIFDPAPGRRSARVVAARQEPQERGRG